MYSMTEQLCVIMILKLGSMSAPLTSPLLRYFVSQWFLLNAKFLFVWNKRVTLKCDIPESAPNCGYWLPSYNLCDKEGWLFVHCRQLQASTQTFALFVAWVFSCYLAANVIKLSVLQSDPRWIDNLLSFQEWLAWISPEHFMQCISYSLCPVSSRIRDSKLNVQLLQ